AAARAGDQSRPRADARLLAADRARQRLRGCAGQLAYLHRATAAQARTRAQPTEVDPDRTGSWVPFPTRRIALDHRVGRDGVSPNSPPKWQLPRSSGSPRRVGFSPRGRRDASSLSPAVAQRSTHRAWNSTRPATGEST